MQINENLNIAYDHQQKVYIPCFDELYRSSITLLKRLKPDFPKNLELP